MENVFFSPFFSYFQGFRRLLANFSPFIHFPFAVGDFPAGVEFRRVGGREFPPVPRVRVCGAPPPQGVRGVGSPQMVAKFKFFKRFQVLENDSIFQKYQDFTCQKKGIFGKVCKFYQILQKFLIFYKLF